MSPFSLPLTLEPTNGLWSWVWNPSVDFGLSPSSCFHFQNNKICMWSTDVPQLMIRLVWFCFFTLLCMKAIHMYMSHLELYFLGQGYVGCSAHIRCCGHEPPRLASHPKGKPRWSVTYSEHTPCCFIVCTESIFLSFTFILTCDGFTKA